MAATRVFVSHASADASFANHLADDLRRQGADCWLDSSHMGSGDFVAHINAALAGRDRVILVLTSAAIQSQWVNREVNAAIARENQGLMRPMIVVMAQPCDPSAIPPLWTTYHRYDATSDFSGAARGVAAELGLAAPQDHQPVQPPTPPTQPASAGKNDELVAATPAPITASGGAVKASVSLRPVAIAALVTLVIAAIGGFLWGSVVHAGLPTTMSSILVAFTLVLSQLAACGTLWAEVRAGWMPNTGWPSHLQLAVSIALAELITTISLTVVEVFSITAMHSPQLNDAIIVLAIALGLCAITLIWSLIDVIVAKQWGWLLTLLVPLLIGIAAAFTNGDVIWRLAIVIASFITWMFLALAFALFGPTRRP